MDHTFTPTANNIGDAVEWAREWNQWTIDENCTHGSHTGHMFHPTSTLSPRVTPAFTASGEPALFIRGWDGKIKTWHIGHTMTFDPNTHTFHTQD